MGSLQSAQGKRAEATAALRAALRLKPGYVPARLKFAENLLGAGNWEETERVHEAIAKKHRDAAEAYHGICRIRAASGDLIAAVESYRRACELFPAYGAAHYEFALACRKLGDSASSEEHLKQHAAD